MKVKEAIKLLESLDPEARLFVASITHGGSVPLQGFIPTKTKEWIDVIYCDDEERTRYGL